MAINTPGDPGILENVVVASVHMYVKIGVSADAVEIIVTSFTEKEILDAKTELIELLGMAKQGGHKDTAERSAACKNSKC